MSDVRSSPFARVFACGTPEPAATPRPLEAGPFTVDVEDGALRAIRWHGVEIVRGVTKDAGGVMKEGRDTHDEMLELLSGFYGARGYTLPA